MPNLDGVLSDWHLSFEVPEKETFSWAVQKAIETGVVCAKPRRDIIQVLRTLMLQHTKYPSSEEYTSISRKLVLKYPTLHDGGTTGFVSDSVSVYHTVCDCHCMTPKTSSFSLECSTCRVHGSSH